MPEEDAPLAVEPQADRIILTNVVVEPEGNVDFRNRVVVKSCLLAACFSLIFGVLLSPIASGILFPFVLFGGGWIASYLYCRNSARPLNVRSGAALGWIAGLFTFVIILMFMALLFMALGNPEFVQALRDSAGKYGGRTEEMNKLLEMPRHPELLALTLALNFVELTVFSSLGGLLYAYSRRRRNG